MTTVPTKTAPTLLAPWRTETDGDHVVVLWLWDEALLESVATRCLHLGNDRIQVARAKHDDRAAFMVRIAAAPYYVIAWCLEQPGELVQVYYPSPVSAGVFVPWGFDVTNPTLLKRALTDDERWLFLQVDGAAPQALEVARWESIYDVLELDFEWEPEDWQVHEVGREHFRVTLRLESRYEPATPELLLLRARERDQIERHLMHSPADELDELEVSVQTDVEGEVFYLIRETRRGRGLGLMQLGGQGLAVFAGIDGLLVPVESTIEPRLRRDQYRHVFKLNPGTLTLLLPGAPNAAPRRLEISRKSFQPLTRLVEHISGFDDATLSDVLQASPFNLGRYRMAPARPDLIGGQATAGPRPRGLVGVAIKPEEAAPGRAPEDVADLPEIELRSTTDELPELKVLGELEEREIMLERLVVRREATMQQWVDLTQLKLEIGKPADAAQAAIGAIWAQRFDRSLGAYYYYDITEKLHGLFARAVQDDPEAKAGQHVVAQAFALGANGQEVNLQALVECQVGLQAHDEALPVATAWIAWVDILRINHDRRAQEEVRTRLLTRLRDSGGVTEIPGFVRERILTDPDIDEDDMVSELHRRQRNIDVVHRHVHHLRTDAIRAAFTGSFARIEADIGLFGEARTHVAEALANPTSESSPMAQAWRLLQARLAVERINAAPSDELLTRLGDAMQELDAGEAAHLERIARDIRKRMQHTSVDEPLLAGLERQSRSFFASNELPPKLAAVLRPLRTAACDDLDPYHAGALVREAFDDALDALEPRSKHSSLEVAQLIRQIVAVLRLYRWDPDAQVVRELEAFANRLPAKPDRDEPSLLYFALVRLTTARGLIDVGRRNAGIGLAAATMGWMAGQDFEMLDFIDLIRKEVLVLIELCAPGERLELLRRLMEMIIAQEVLFVGNLASGSMLDLPIYAREFLEMLDLVLEAAVGHDTLVQKRLQDFAEWMEYDLRRRIRSDRPAR